MIAGGAGVVVLEELEHAKARGARIYGELVGYGATSDGFDMVRRPARARRAACAWRLLTSKAAVDYINPHGTSTPVGDEKEIEAIREVFGKDMPADLAPPSRSPAIRWAPPACRKRSTRC